MKRNLLVIASLLLLLLTVVSCELFYRQPAKGTMRMLVYGNTYRVNKYNNSYYNFVTGYRNSQGRETEGAFGGGNTSVNGVKIPPSANDAVQVGNAFASYAVKSGLDFEITYMLGEDLSDVVDGDGSLVDRITDLKTKGVLSDANCHIVSDMSEESFLSELKKLSDKSADEDILILFYSGHGIRMVNDIAINQTCTASYGKDLLNEGYFWLCDTANYKDAPDEDKNAVKKDPAKDSARLLKFKDLYETLEKVKGKKLMILDNCYSGCMITADGLSVDDNLYQDVTAFDLFTSSKEMNVSSSLFVLAASEYNNSSWFDLYSPSNGFYNSNFTGKMMDAIGWDVKNNCLKDSAPAFSFGHLTVHSLSSYLYQNYNTSKKGKVGETGGSQDLIIF